MAQAARLNLRMQKELKQFLSDPPPGASLPHLSTSSSASLSTFHAQIEGPEGTVYENGFFQIKIQIPERYPFQPPIVMFATPIYHPNIDTGGRICLDILNLPPKGAWQPSLNLFTVLMSIRLLLSEPNPDDGLMCEASREYKYNRQAFDQKAQSMTEKYAKAVGGSSSSQYLIDHSTSGMADTKVPDKVSKDEANDEKIVHRKNYGVSQKMSLGSSRPSQNMDDDRRVKEVLNLSSAKQMSNQGPPQWSKESSKATSPSDALHRTGHKLSLASLDQSQKSTDALKVKTSQDIHPVVSDSDRMAHVGLSLPLKSDIQHKLQHREEVKLSHGKISLRPKKLCLASQKQSLGSPSTCQDVDGNCTMKDASPKVFKLHTNNSMPEPQVGKDGLKPLAEPSGLLEKGSDGLNYKKLSAAKKLSSGYKGSCLNGSDKKENLMPNQSSPDKVLIEFPVSRLCSQSPDSGNRRMVGNSQKEDVLSRKLSLQPMRQLKESNSRSSPLVESVNDDNYDSNRKRKYNEDQDGKLSFETIHIAQKATEEPSMTEEVIVLDSEDSDEERNEPLRSKLSLARRRLALKCRGKS